MWEGEGGERPRAKGGPFLLNAATAWRKMSAVFLIDDLYVLRAAEGCLMQMNFRDLRTGILGILPAWCRRQDEIIYVICFEYCLARINPPSVLPAIIMVPNCWTLWNCFSWTVINIWDASTRQLADVLILRGLCQRGIWRNEETTETGKCGRNTVLCNRMWIRNTNKWRHKESIDNKDGSWASGFDGVKTLV